MLQKLVKWIAINQHPFTIVNEPNLVDFVHALCPNAVLVSADTIKRKIMDLYESNVSEIQKALQNIPGRISFTLDIWTSPSTKLFLSITAHYIDDNWKLRNVLIDFIQIFGKNFLIS